MTTVTDIRRTIVDPEHARLVKRCEDLTGAVDAAMRAGCAAIIQQRAVELTEARAELRGYQSAAEAILGAITAARAGAP